MYCKLLEAGRVLREVLLYELVCSALPWLSEVCDC